MHGVEYNRVEKGREGEENTITEKATLAVVFYGRLIELKSTQYKSHYTQSRCLLDFASRPIQYIDLVRAIRESIVINIYACDITSHNWYNTCLLYTSDAADE